LLITTAIPSAIQLIYPLNHHKYLSLGNMALMSSCILLHFYFLKVVNSYVFRVCVFRVCVFRVCVFRVCVCVCLCSMWCCKMSIDIYEGFRPLAVSLLFHYMF